MKDPKTFPCMDDSPLNMGGYGYNHRDRDEREEPEEETIEDDSWEDEE